jgi:hypothetical protein
MRFNCKKAAILLISGIVTQILPASPQQQLPGHVLQQPGSKIKSKPAITMPSIPFPASWYQFGINYTLILFLCQLEKHMRN